MKRKQWTALLLAVSMMASMLSGCASRAKITEDMIPTVVDLRKDEAEETTAKLIGLAMNKAHMAELVRLDGDNTQMAAVDAKTIPVVLKATSVDKDLKVKIVNKKNDRVITGTKFEVTVKDSKNKKKSYTDDDKDGIIYIKSMEPGKCEISMKTAGAYAAPEDITAEVKANIEYKVIDVGDEIKKESEINVSQEDASNTGNEGAGTAVVLKDTVEFVASTKTEIMRQKVDEFGTPMHEKIISEPARFCTDANKDGKCDRCGVIFACSHTYAEDTGKRTEPTCVTEGSKTLVCSLCGDAKTEVIAKDSSKHNFTNGVCAREGCGAADPNYQAPHEHEWKAETPAGCETVGKKICDCGASEEIPAKGHDYSQGDICANGCGTVKPGTEGSGESGPATPENTPEGQAVASVMARNLHLVTTIAVNEKIVYDTKSAPIMEGTGEYKYTGWQTIDNATYYFDKNGKKVTGSQVIQGIQYTFNSQGIRSGTIGIDVSKFQPSVNWKKVKNAGINFVIIRCGYRGYGSGVLVEDPMFASHISGAKAAGLRVGVYFFSQAITEAEAVEEASMAVKLANKYGINMPIAIDSEYANAGKGRADGLSKSDRTKITIAFCNTVRNAGHTAMVYASKSWFSTHLDVSKFSSSYRIWVAQYADKCTYTGRYDIWQNTSKGKVDGISGNVDMNISSI